MSERRINIRVSEEEYDRLDEKRFRKGKLSWQQLGYSLLMRWFADSVPDSEQELLCPYCRSITYAGCEHLLFSEAKDVPKLEQGVRSVESLLQSLPEPARVEIERLLEVLDSDSETAKTGIRVAIDTNHRLMEHERRHVKQY